MRQIVFRIWSKEDNCFYSKRSEVCRLWDIAWLWECDNYVVEQWTGLLDKNGEGIYEADILIMNPRDDEWYDIVEWRKRECCFQLRGYSDPCTTISLVEAINKKESGDDVSYVVGNIHQNKELLNES